MGIKRWLKGVYRPALLTAFRYAEEFGRGERLTEAVLRSVLIGSEQLSTSSDPVSHVDFLRSCIRPLHYAVRELRPDTDSSDPGSRRFASLVDLLRNGVPPFPLSAALVLVAIAEDHWANRHPVDTGRWAGDVGLGFQIGASPVETGRVIWSVLRLMQATDCIEVGTQYGMSAAFILEAFKVLRRSGNLTTIERSELAHTVAAAALTKHYGAAVSLCLGSSDDVLPSLARAGRKFDFMYHDATHSRDSYVSDFRHIESALRPGAVVVFDDIRWENPRFHSGAAPPNCYAGWLDVVGHRRVRRAIEISERVGLLFLR